MVQREHLFKIIFFQRDMVYEIFARQVGESDMYGFIVVEELVFGEPDSLVIDPSVEKLKTEFGDVTRIYIPIPYVLRIDEVESCGTPKILEAKGERGNVSLFPGVVIEK